MYKEKMDCVEKRTSLVETGSRNAFMNRIGVQYKTKDDCNQRKMS